MNQFDETTRKKSIELGYTAGNLFLVPFMNGRDSTKASMEVLARAADEISIVDHDTEEALATVRYDDLMGLFSAIAAVKANSDWPLEESNE